MVNYPALGGGLLVAAIGAYGLQNTVRSFRQSRHLKSSSVTDVARITPGSGLVEVEGTARPATGETIDAGIAGEDAVLCLTTVEERKGTGGAGGETGSRKWHPIDRSVETVPFYVEDGTGKARIEVPEIDTKQRLLEAGLNPTTVTLAVDPDPLTTEGPPGPLDVAELFDVDLDPDTRYRFRQAVIAVDGDAYAAGYPERATEDVEADVVVSGEEDPSKMVLADKPEAEVESGTTGAAVWGIALAALMLVGGLGLVAVGAGVV